MDADGVHLGQDDLPTDVARGLIGPGRLLGRSTHSLNQVAEAHREDCDYLGLGPVNNTAVKPERPAIGAALVGEALAITHKPVFAIGGISQANLDALMAVGCRRVAVIGAIMGSDNPEKASQNLLSSLSRPTL